MQFFITISVILGSGYGYVVWRVLGPLGGGFAAVALGLVIVVGFVGLSLAALILPYRYPLARWPRLLSWAAYLSLGFLCVFGSLLLFRDLAWLGWSGLRALGLVGDGITQESLRSLTDLPLPGFARFAPPTDSQGWLVCLNGLMFLAAAVLFGLGVLGARGGPRVVEVTVPIARLPASFEGFRIVQISDVHVGSTIRADFVRRIVERVNALAGDMIAVTGDLVDGGVEQLRAQVAPLADLRARHGVFFVAGNHDYYSGIHGWLRAVRELGMDALVNEHRVLVRGSDRLVVAGVTDFTAGRFVAAHTSDPAKAIAGAPPEAAKILLAHQPYSAFAAARLDYDLQLSGHTHGGQFFPGTFFVRLVQPYVAGLHRRKNMWIYVNRGTGYWGPPLRLHSPAEITVIRLTSKVRSGAG